MLPLSPCTFTPFYARRSRAFFLEEIYRVKTRP
jgi:hypothetical protein